MQDRNRNQAHSIEEWAGFYVHKGSLTLIVVMW